MLGPPGKRGAGDRGSFTGKMKRGTPEAGSAHPYRDARFLSRSEEGGIASPLYPGRPETGLPIFTSGIFHKHLTYHPI